MNMFRQLAFISIDTITLMFDKVAFRQIIKDVLLTEIDPVQYSWNFTEIDAGISSKYCFTCDGVRIEVPKNSLYPIMYSTGTDHLDLCDIIDVALYDIRLHITGEGMQLLRNKFNYKKEHGLSTPAKTYDEYLTWLTSEDTENPIFSDIEKWHCTRLDVALDFINHEFIIEKLFDFLKETNYKFPAKSRLIESSVNISSGATVYIGGVNAQRKFRIYDKLAEVTDEFGLLKKNKEFDFEQYIPFTDVKNWQRFELQLRRPVYTGKLLNKTFHKNFLSNPEGYIDWLMNYYCGRAEQGSALPPWWFSWWHGFKNHPESIIQNEYFIKENVRTTMQKIYDREVRGAYAAAAYLADPINNFATHYDHIKSAMLQHQIDAHNTSTFLFPVLMAGRDISQQTEFICVDGIYQLNDAEIIKNLIFHCFDKDDIEIFINAISNLNKLDHDGAFSTRVNKFMAKYSRKKKEVN